MLHSLVEAAALALVISGADATELPRHAPRRAKLPRHGVTYTPGIRIWTSGSDLHRRGDRVRLFYRTERNAYVTIFRVDTDGQVRVLFPATPDDENYGYGGATYSVRNYDRQNAFMVDDDEGVGYLFGVASADPFDYNAMIGDVAWDLSGLVGGRLHGDPRAGMEELIGNILPSGYAEFDTHLLPYYVGERRHDYPRFVCYDCHTYMPFSYWDPYSAWCRRFTLTVFNDPYYYYPSYWYPYGYSYGGARAVYVQPGGSYAGARYVFKNRDNAASGIEYRDRRRTTTTATGPSGRRTTDGDVVPVRGRDLTGGVGAVPAPRTPGRRAAPFIGSGEQPREARTGEQRAPTGSTTGERRRTGTETTESGQPVTDQQSAARRRADETPSVEIVPRRDTDGYVTPTPGRQPATRYGDEPRPPRPNRETMTNRPDLVPRHNTDGESRPARPDATRQAPRSTEQSRPEGREAATEPRSAAPERREAAPDRRAEPAPPRQPEATPKPRESRPESKPERAQPSQPRESRPQASPPRESPPQASPPAERSQPRSSPPKSDPAPSRRRP